MSFWTVAWRSYVTANRIAAGAAHKADHALHQLRTIQALLVTALVVLAATAVVSIVLPQWSHYAYAAGAVILAIPLVAILVMVWKPLHSRPVRMLATWAQRDSGPSAANAEVKMLRREIKKTKKQIKKMHGRKAEIKAS